MDLARKVTIKEEREDLMDFSEVQDVSGRHNQEVDVKVENEDQYGSIDSDDASYGQTHQVFVKVGNEDSLDISYERNPLDAQIDEIFIKTEEEDPLDDSGAEDSFDVHLDEPKTEELDIKEEPIEFESNEEEEVEIKEEPVDMDSDEGEDVNIKQEPIDEDSDEMVEQESSTDGKKYLEGRYGDMKIRIKVEEDPLDNCDVEAMLDGKFLEPKVELEEGSLEKDEQLLDSDIMEENSAFDNSQMNMRKLIRMMARRKDFLCYLIWKGLLVRDPPCHVCGLPMIMTFRTSRCYQEYRCRKEGPTQHKVAVSVLKNSWFSCAKIPMDKVMLFTYMFALGYTSFETLIRETSSAEYTTSRSTVADWLSFCREVTLDWCVKNQAGDRIAGKGVVVDVEVVKMGKRKAGGRREAVGNATWVVGLIETKVGNCGRFRIEVTDKHDQRTLLPRLEKVVEVGTTIVCDHWRCCYRLTKTGFRKVGVVGGKVVIQPSVAAGARPSEYEWKLIRRRVIGFPRKRQEMQVHEYLWRRHVKMNCLDPYEHFLCCIKELYKLNG